MHDRTLTTTTHEGLLQSLRTHHFLTDYRLAIYTRHDESGVFGAQRHPLQTSACSTLCNAVCIPGLAQALNTAIDDNRQVLFRCPAGLPAFAVPLGTAVASDCLVGCGVRDQTFDLSSLRRLAATVYLDPLDLLVQLETLPVAAPEELAEAARKVSHLIRSLRQVTCSSVLYGNSTEGLGVVVKLAADIDRAETAEEAISLLSETLGILFDIPGIAIARATEDGQSFLLHGTWGVAFEAATLSAGELTRLFSPRLAATIFMEEDRCEEFFPGVRAGNATCLPLATGNELLGLVALLDTAIQGSDLHLAEILVGRVATRLAQLKKDEEQRLQVTRSARYVAMISALVLAEGMEELCRNIVEMAAELVQATCGSLMLLEEDGQTLRIEAAVGMNPSLAKSLSARVGTGIAGKVAASGHPLLVNDIEKDIDPAIPNRPRFKTKAFVSMPLRFKERTIGVLNLSDKEHQEIYTEEDLETLLPFVEHAALLVERARSLARTDLLERLSVTDALTELFNRRFLEKRLEEELNRARRHGLQLTLVMIDLDSFKKYNDLYGHPAGDKALKKTARVLRASVREMDVVTRFGGEEFCIILPDTAKKESHFVADRIRRGIEKQPFTGEEELPAGRLTASLGIASFPEDGDTASSLTRAADVALYQAKEAGRNRIVFYSASSPGEDQASPHPMVNEKGSG